MNLADVEEHMEVIGADGVHVGTVDQVLDDRIKLTRGEDAFGRHRYIPLGLVAEVEGRQLRLSANGDVAIVFEEVADDKMPTSPANENERLDEAELESFPASDPPATY